jgi:predicted LPLAT superfamily acyltransferase
MSSVPISSTPTTARHPLHWDHLPEAGMSAGLWFLYWSHRLFGRGLYRVLMWPVCWYFILVRPVARCASIDYLQRAGQLSPQAGAWARWRAAARHVRAFADTLLDKALVWTGGLDIRQVNNEVDPRFDAAVAAGRGGVMVVAHVGNLEVLRAIGERLQKLRLHILVHTRHAERFNRMLERMNPQSAERLLQVTEIDTSRIAQLAHQVEAGDFVVIAADRVPVQPLDGAVTGERTMDVPFLGGTAPLPIGPWVLAAALDCPVYWLACYKRAGDGDRYTLVCEQVCERVALPRATRKAALAQVISLYVARLERVAREAPLAWFNFYPYWRKDRKDPKDS